MCNIHRNGWRITRGMQPEWSLLCLESCGYNKSHPSPKLIASLRLRIRSISSFVQILLGFPKYCLHIVHFQPSALLGSHPSSSHIIVALWVPSCILPDALMALVNHQVWPNTQDRVALFLRHVNTVSPTTSYIHSVLLSQRITSPITPMIDSVWKFLPRWGCHSHIGIW
jgi:hypothetical protein